MTNELKPCPFCGGKAKSWYTQDDFWCAGRAGCANEDCCIRPVARGTNEAAAINIWNTRYKRTCKLIMHEGSPACSKCLAEQDYNAKFCDQCGAEVIDGD